MKKTVLLLIATLIVTVSCQPAPTPVPPTPTPIPFKCNITTESYGFEIVGESGQVSTTMHDEATSYQYAPSGQRSGITVNINRDLTFTNSKNTYKIVGKIILDLIANSVSYDITATGGTFGNNPQTCKK